MADVRSRRDDVVLSLRASLALQLALCATFVVAQVLAFDSVALAGEVHYEFAAPAQDAHTKLSSEGFEFKLDADNSARAHLSLSDRGLTVETLAPAEPLIAHQGLNVAQPARMSVTWGVHRYPIGANWDTGVNNEAIMAMVFFGTEKLSGGFFVPPSPYFIGFFLCENGHRSAAIAGRSYKTQGRYVCVDGPPTDKEITSMVALADAFRAAFHIATVPPVTAIALEADTTQVGATAARSSAWVKSLQITPPN